jgi:hypothetical protein
MISCETEPAGTTGERCVFRPPTFVSFTQLPSLPIIPKVASLDHMSSSPPTPKSPTGSQRSPPKEKSVASTVPPPVKLSSDGTISSKIDPTINVLQRKLDELHSLIMHPKNEMAEPIRNECHFLCMDAHKVLLAEELRTQPNRPLVAYDQPKSPRQEAKEKALTNQKLRKSWQRFLKKCSGSMSPEEVALLSLPTIKELMHHYQFDRSPVEMANVELYWRALAQQREDDRHQAALAYKKCAAATVDTKKPPGRVIAENQSPIRK